MYRAIRPSTTKSFARLGACSFQTFGPRLVNVGDSIPAVQVFENSPSGVVDLAKETEKGKYLIIGVPGAFSPACSGSHLPGYIEKLPSFEAKGVNGIFVVTVNDPFVTSAWAKSLGVPDKVRVISDSLGDFTSSLDLMFDAAKFFGNSRSKRYALIVEDGKVSDLFVEPDSTGVEVSEATKVLDAL